MYPKGWQNRPNFPRATPLSNVWGCLDLTLTADVGGEKNSAIKCQHPQCFCFDTKIRTRDRTPFTLRNDPGLLPGRSSALTAAEKVTRVQPCSIPGSDCRVSGPRVVFFHTGAQLGNNPGNCLGVKGVLDTGAGVLIRMQCIMGAQKVVRGQSASKRVSQQNFECSFGCDWSIIYDVAYKVYKISKKGFSK